MKFKRINILIFGVGLGFVGGIALISVLSRWLPRTKFVDNPENSKSRSSIDIGTDAPDFSLKSISGKYVRLTDFRGKVVLLNFWATWCSPCRIEMPTFQSLHDGSSGEIEILTINAHDSPEDIHAYLNDLNLSLEVLLDNEHIVHEIYQVRGFPTTFLISSDGRIRFQHIGFVTQGQLEEYLREIGLH